MFNNTQPADPQIVDLQHVKACLFDHQTTYRKTTDRQRSDGDCTERCRSQRERQQGSRGTCFYLSRYFTHHW